MNKKNDYILKAETGHIKVGITDSVTIKVESNYLFRSRKEYCEEFLKKDTNSQTDILEFLLALHFVLEIGINTFFRNYYNVYSILDTFMHDNELDNVSCLDKIRFFLSSNRFTFRDGKDKAESYKNAKNLIGGIKNFNNIRNMIVHGHSVSEVTGQHNVTSNLKLKLNSKSYGDQINKFKEVMVNLNYFVDRLETFVAKEQIEAFQTLYLSTEFLSVPDNT
ncbi:MAG: hypothetical protein WC059_02545 [Candidatus Paceibacterota bacterium]